MTNVANYSNLRIDGDILEITVDGVVVQGRITHRDKRHIGVEIISPYCGLSENSDSIPLLGLQVYSFLGKTGDRKAASMLCALYRFCQYAEGHMDSLLAALAHFKCKKIYARCFSQEALSTQERKTAALKELQALRKALKEGAVDNLEYQRRITPLTKEMKLLAEEPETDLDEIFDECFYRFKDTPVWDLGRDAVITYLGKTHKSGIPENEGG